MALKTESAPFSTVRLMVVKIRYITLDSIQPWIKVKSFVVLEHNEMSFQYFSNLPIRNLLEVEISLDKIFTNVQKEYENLPTLR